jgi:hypothetical protein
MPDCVWGSQGRGGGCDGEKKDDRPEEDHGRRATDRKIKKGVRGL